MTKQEQNTLRDNPTPRIEPNPESVPLDYWGICPWCGRHDGYITIGPLQYFVCHTHKTYWQGGRIVAWYAEYDQDSEISFRNYKSISDYRNIRAVCPDLMQIGESFEEHYKARH
jgi:hypothetical protein